MSSGCHERVSGDACSHQETIDDDREGYCVCIECGLVLEQIYQQGELCLKKPLNLLSLREEDEADTFLRDVCSRAEIPPGISQAALSYFRKIRQQLLPHKRKFGYRDVASYALYETLSRVGASRTKREISFYTGCNVARLWDVESLLDLEDTLEDPSDYIGRFCFLLGIKSAEVAKIRRVLCDWTFLEGVTPQCAAAACIFWFCSENNKSITLKKVCEACDVSSANISGIIRKMSTAYKNKISMMRL